MVKLKKKHTLFQWIMFYEYGYSDLAQPFNVLLINFTKYIINNYIYVIV
jgi:hypothetical protein